MGQFSFKNEEKKEEKGNNNYLEYCSYNYQCFKKNNYNTFSSKISQGKEKNFDIFCIFVGNNGNEISKFINNHFYLELLKNIDEKNLNIKEAIEHTFLFMNHLLKEPESKKEIAQLRLENLEEENKNKKKIVEEKEVAIEILEDEVNEILDYTGCSACIVLIDEIKEKLYFGNLGNTEVIIYHKNKKKAKKEENKEIKEDKKNKEKRENKENDPIIFASNHKPTDDAEKLRIEQENGLIINDKLYGILNTTRGFGNFAYIKSNEYSQLVGKIFSDEPDILIYEIKDDDEYIFIGTESIIECIDKKGFNEIIGGDESIDNKKSLEDILKDNISSDFYNNDTEFGFDSIICTLIKLKKNEKEEKKK